MTQLAIDRELTLIAFEAMNHWTRRRLVGLHVFHKNNELAGYCSVLQALELTGITGDYGRRLSAVVIGFGATARGAVTALNAHGVHDVAVLTNRGVAAVGLPHPLGADPPVRPRPRATRDQPGDHRPRPRTAGGLPGRERHRRQLHAAGHRCAADLPRADDLAAFRQGSLIVDVSCDEGDGLRVGHADDVRRPDVHRGRTTCDYYAVDHSPSYLWNSATWENSEALLPFLPTVIAGPDAWDADETISRAIEIRDGRVQNPAILAFQGRADAAPAPGRLTGRYQASASSARVSSSSCGSVFVPPMTVMKLASPDQRGYDVLVQVVGQRPAGDPPEVEPDVERVRAADLLDHPDRLLRHRRQLAGLLGGRAPRARRRAGRAAPSGARGCRGAG